MGVSDAHATILVTPSAMGGMTPVSAQHLRVTRPLAATTATRPEDHPDHAVAWAADFAAGPEMKLRILPEPVLPETGLPQPDEVWLWLGLPAHAAAAEGWRENLPWLSEEEVARTHRFRFAQDRWSYATVHAALRLLLSELLGRAPAEIAFCPGSRGKPLLCPSAHGHALSQAVQFNISHTRGMVAVTLSGSPIGVDVEPVRPLPDMRQLVMDLMAPEALAAYDDAASEQEKMRLFFRYWTLGEAFIKATGQGLDQGLDSFAFTEKGKARLTRVTPGWGHASRWHMGVMAPASR